MGLALLCFLDVSAQFRCRWMLLGKSIARTNSEIGERLILGDPNHRHPASLQCHIVAKAVRA